MGTVSLPNSLINQTLADATEVMADFNAILAQLNGNIEAVNIKDGTITAAKLAAGAISSGLSPYADVWNMTLSADTAGLPTGTTYVVPYDVANIDPDGKCDIVTNKGVVTIATTGIWLVGAQVFYNSTEVPFLYITKDPLATKVDLATAGYGLADTTIGISAVVSLAEGDKLAIRHRSSSICVVGKNSNFWGRLLCASS